MMVSIIFILTLFQIDNTSIDSLISCLVPEGDVKVELLRGKFEYYKSDHNAAIYKAIFVGDSSFRIEYTTYGSYAVSDSVFIEDVAVSIPRKNDALTTQVYKLKFGKINYLCFLSNSSSASGTGNQIKYYSLFELENDSVKKVSFFNSRFGMMQNIGDINDDGQLDFLMISNTGKSSKPDGRNIFKAEVCDFNGNVLSDNFVNLEYLGNNKVKIIEVKWFFNIDCN